jgi:hypothetical protein
MPDEFIRQPNTILVFIDGALMRDGEGNEVAFYNFIRIVLPGSG